MRDDLKGTNAWKMFLVGLAAVVAAAVGIHHVWIEREPLLARQRLFDELSHNRELVRTRERYERKLVDLMSAPNLNRWARKSRGMRPPRPNEVISVGTEEARQ